MSHCLDAHSQMLWDTANKWEAPERYWAALNRDFERVEFLGMTDDNYVRPLFRCWK